MPQSLRIIDPPNITPLRKPPGTKQSQIYSDTYIQIIPAEPGHKVYFSTDGDEPDPWQRIQNGQERTFKYKGPFRLREGPRIVRAISVSRKDRASSRITTKAFQVITNPNAVINEDTETDSSTLVSVTSLTTDASETQLEHSSHLLFGCRTPGHQDPQLNIEPQSYKLKDIDVTDSSGTFTTDDELPELKKVNKYGQSLRKLDMSLHTDRYNDIRKVLDANYRNEIYNKKKNVDLIDTSSDPILHGVETCLDKPSCLSFIKSVDSGDETEISNYFGQPYQTSPVDTWAEPNLSNHSAPRQEPPAFWSTQTPRVRFSDAPSQRISPVIDDWCHSDTGYQQSQTAYTEGLGDEYTGYKKRNEPLSRYDKHEQDLTSFFGDSTCHGDKRGNRSYSDFIDKESKAFHSNKQPVRHHSPGLDGRKSPLADVSYKVGYKFATGYLSDPEISCEKEKQSTISSSSSSSSSGSESDQSESERMSRREKHMKNKKDKKKSSKKKKKTKKMDQEKEEKTDKNKKEQENKEKSKLQGHKEKNDKELLSDTDLLIRKIEKPDNLPPDHGSPSKRVLKTKQGGLSFVNDSGTQINFWGTPPEEVVKKVSQMIPLATEYKADQTVPSIKPAPQATPAASDILVQEQAVPPNNTTTSLDTEFDPELPVVKTQHQKEQQSVGSFFRKLFKMDDKKKDKQKELPSTVTEFGESEFEKLLQKCLKKGKLWEDPDFKAEDSSVYYNECPVDGKIEWKRPNEICDDPQMFIGGASRFDVKQGVLGNCWLLAAVASLTTNKKLLHQVVPHKQNFNENYAGIFCFRFWQYGKWVEVIIDDRLPTFNGKLIFMHSEEGNEFWSPLLEKAYAKICGCYENLTGGLASEAMTDFTGGVTEQFNFREELPDNMFQIMLKAYERKSLMGCSIDASPDEIEAELDNGLIKGHAYSITAAKVIDSDSGEVKLIRVRNPWGNECEWKGAWSDQSEEWQNIADDVKESIGLQFDHDGEFWMSFRDFSTYFQRMEICHLSPDSLGSDDGSTTWICKTFPGAWKKNINAGGCRNFPKSYHTNPQYRIQITDADDDDEEEIGTIIVGLMQKGRRKLRAEGGGNLTMGYEIFSTEGVTKKQSLDREFFKKHKPVLTSAYINMREICTRHRLTPGNYCIVLTTYEPNEETEYLLRVFSEKPSDMAEADESTSIVIAQNTSVAHSAPGQALEAEKQFKKYGGEDEEVEASELQNIINHVFTKDFKFSGFDINLCRSMIAMSDDDHTGKLTLKEFKVLWTELQKCKNVFRKYDTDKSCNLNSFELREALKHCGYTVSNTTFQSLVLRFSDKDGNVHFDDFVACVIKLRTLYRIFASQTEKDTATFTLEDFIKHTVYS